MEIITGFTGAKHVRSEQDRDINIGTFGEESYVLQTGMKMAAEVSSNNEIKIRDGVIMHQGCAASIKKNTYDSVTIVNGSQGMKRIDLIVARYQRNQDDGKEFMRFVAIQGTPAESNPAVPSHITGDIQSGDAVADMPMYKIIIDGLNIVEVQKVFSEAPNITELNRKLNKVYRTKPVSGVEVVRVGNTVTLNVNRVVGGVQGNFVYSGHFGTVPPGYRPATENSLLLVGDRIVGSTVVGKFYASIFPDGKIEWSSENSHSGPNSYVFYATYVTSDQLPVE
ncbi:MAG: hypothetical protein ACLSBC_15525 [[Clostridium] scindens]|jgi:hypothetical protein|uniref:hypothetical protein n=1 Tax=Clostridium scindens (strain JCM 10418 / VPI 12708) TaxID=29347 RepID=UPI003993483F